MARFSPNVRSGWCRFIFINYLYQYVHPISIEYPDSSMLYQFC